MKKLLQIGAGKIGRSFIAQIFSKADYSIVFADIDPCIVNSLNEAGCYTVLFKKNESTEKYTVENVSAIEITSVKKVINEIIEADVISISVGKKSLLKLSRLLSQGIKRRHSLRSSNPIDIILAENVRDAASLLYGEINRLIPDIPVIDYVGFVETSIGKMVPLMTEEQLKEDPLAVFAEPYNSLIVDANGFRNQIPDIPDIVPKTNMKAWVDRKIFIHNLGHAALAYQCNYSYPEVIYTWQALEISEIFEITRKTMWQSAQILRAMYPDDFTLEQLEEHIDDLLHRFGNRALGDTIFRVGNDLSRKLGRDDRLIIPILNAIELRLDYRLIMEAWVKGCFFIALSENGKLLPEDKRFNQKFRQNPVRILIEHCTFDPDTDKALFQEAKSVLNEIKHYES